MDLIETTISENSVRLRYAEEPNPTEGDMLLELHIGIRDLIGLPSGEIAAQRLSLIQIAALRYAQNLIGKEIGRLTNLAASTA